MAKILWIEDEARDQLIEYVGPLMRDGHTIDIVEDASEGYQRLTESNYDVVIFDLLIKSGSNFNMEEEYPGLTLLKRIFGTGNASINLDKNSVMIFTVVTHPKIVQQIQDLGITRIKVKERMEKTRLKSFVDEILKDKKKRGKH